MFLQIKMNIFINDNMHNFNKITIGNSINDSVHSKYDQQVY